MPQDLPEMPPGADARPPAAAHAALWHQGWLRTATPCPSPNFGPRPGGACTDLIVVHSISLPPGIYGTGDVQRLFTNQLDWDAHPYFQTIRGLQVSSHFFITREGAVWQFVSADERAWHAGQSFWRGRPRCNDDSIGIELEGLEARPSSRRSTRAWCSCASRSARSMRLPISPATNTSRPAARTIPAPAFPGPACSRSWTGLPRCFHHPSGCRSALGAEALFRRALAFLQAQTPAKCGIFSCLKNYFFCALAPFCAGWQRGSPRNTRTAVVCMPK
jgi:N-acetyl-anhydromuramoyl-L-alanine amidase